MNMRMSLPQRWKRIDRGGGEHAVLSLQGRITANSAPAAQEALGLPNWSLRHAKPPPTRSAGGAGHAVMDAPLVPAVELGQLRGGRKWRRRQGGDTLRVQPRVTAQTAPSR